MAKTAADTEEKAKVSRKVTKTEVVIEMDGTNVSVTDIQNAVKKTLKAQKITGAKINIYINAYEHAAYYTVDGEAKEEYKLDLNTL